MKSFFYEDELPRREHESFTRKLNIPREEGRFLRILRHNSLRDIDRAGLNQGGPEEEIQVKGRSASSGFWICGQGTPKFAGLLRDELGVEKRKRQRVVRRTSIGR